MKKSVMMMAIAAMALTVACTGKKTTDNVDNQDSTSLVDSSAAIAPIDLTTIVGTYEGTLPAADGPGIKTIVTLNADSTYQITQDYLGRKKDVLDAASGVFKVLEGKVLMLVRPSSGEHTFYKVKDDNNIVLTDSLGNEPEGETAKFYVLTKKK